MSDTFYQSIVLTNGLIGVILVFVIIYNLNSIYLKKKRNDTNFTSNYIFIGGAIVGVISSLRDVYNFYN